MMLNIHPKKEEADKDRAPSSETEHDVIPYEHEENTAEGSEFLDDALRMKEQPFEETSMRENE